MQRKDDKTQQAHYRTSRMFQQEGGWYFRTREGGVIGPFHDELATSTQLEVYIRMVESGLMSEQELNEMVKNTA